jgi:hypothetical protein
MFADADKFGWWPSMILPIAFLANVYALYSLYIAANEFPVEAAASGCCAFYSLCFFANFWAILIIWKFFMYSSARSFLSIGVLKKLRKV